MKNCCIVGNHTFAAVRASDENYELIDSALWPVLDEIKHLNYFFFYNIFCIAKDTHIAEVLIVKCTLCTVDNIVIPLLIYL